MGREKGREDRVQVIDGEMVREDEKERSMFESAIVLFFSFIV